MTFNDPLIHPVLALGAAEPSVRFRAVQQLIRQLPIPGFLETLRHDALEELAAYQPVWPEKLVLRRPAAAFPVAMALSVWRHLPARVWFTFLKGKLWPETAYLNANAPDIGSRSRYLRNLLKRSQDKA
jgi:hypothetical protein